MKTLCASAFYGLCADGTVAEVARLNFELGELFADAALRVLESCSLQPRNVI
jgi:hypothetical protein